MRVAAIQMTSTPDKTRNLAVAHDLLIEAKDDKGAELVAFPENFSLLTDSKAELLKEAETLKGVTVETLQEWAAEYDVWILAGSLPMKVPGDPRRITNTSLLLSPEGEIRARYDKIHLFDVHVKGDRAYHESAIVKPGRRVVTAEVSGARAGLSICYDLRFPELYRRMGQVDVIFIPSAFTALTGKAHWDTLTRTRAIENQCYVVCPAQAGSPFAGRECHGHTRIIDPWGRILAERPAGPGVVWADLKADEIERVRRELPALTHRVLR
jgi:predicted amidohydrolase